MEDIKKIAESIRRHRSFETTLDITNSAVGRSKVTLAGQENTLWLTLNENQGSSQVIRDIQGNPKDFVEAMPHTLTKDGKPIYKNTKLGEFLTLYYEGIHKYKAPAGEFPLEIFNRAVFTPERGEDAIDLKINKAGDKETYQFKRLSELLTELQKTETELAKLIASKDKEKNAEKISGLIKEIVEKEKELEDKKSKVQSFIRTKAELRLQHILDAEQEKIKRSNIFKGTLIIDGGPGTGKTTSLIQRIKFLTAKSIMEYKPKLTSGQKELLGDEKKNWIFFSPSELLRLYLKNNMTMEGLHASDEKVKVWSNFKRELCIRYKLFNAETKQPFLSYNKKVDFFAPNNRLIQKLFSDYDAFFIQVQLAKLTKIGGTNLQAFSWKKSGNSIQKYIARERKLDSWGAWFNLYINLGETFEEDTKEIIKKYNDLIQLISTKYLSLVKEDLSLQKRVYEYLESLKKNTVEDLEDEDDLDESEDFGELNTAIKDDNELILSRRLKTLCRKYALRKYDTNTKFTKSDRDLNEIIPGLKDNSDYEALGQLAYFIKYFKRVLSGPVVNILGETAKIYKLFRKQKLAAFLTDEGKDALSEILKDKNKRIHEDEQAFLLNKINIVVKELFSTSPKTYSESNHPFITAFRDSSKAVIGIDEASDFSLIDILSMHSLGHPLISSVTLSGDLMQRMTKQGIRKWEEITNFIDDVERRNLLVSYRQSHTVIELAKKIYKAETRLESKYRAYGEKDISEPKPLAFYSTVEAEKVDWIANRIIEVYNSYGNLMPSIAIFLSENHDEFTNELNKKDILSDVGIKVVLCRDGQMLGDRNSVRVFPIEFIKGLEFEAVFFHNIDSIEKNQQDKDLVVRYLYVGLSRAAFYMGITGNGLPKSLSVINSLMSAGNWKI